MLRLFKLFALVALAVNTECQVNFGGSNLKSSSSDESYEGCTANNGQRGLCYEYRSTKFKECSSFFPSTDTSNPEVAAHLTQNTCKNDAHDSRELFFCCPSSNFPLKGVIPSEEECGLSLSNNVVYGKLTKPGQWPWLASIGNLITEGYQHVCGGTLITKQHVISAAHCFTPKAKRDYPGMFVRLGEYDVDKADDGAIDFKIMTERMHIDYNTSSGENDIILLKLDRLLSSYTDSIRPACLPYHLRDEHFLGEEILTVVGWGIFNNTIGKTAPAPFQAVVPVVRIPQCHQSYQEVNSARKITNKQLCAGTGGTEGAPDSCGGDSGGPLNYLDVIKERFYLVGAVSFGPKLCGHGTLPGVYARIGYYLDWIEENISQTL